VNRAPCQVRFPGNQGALRLSQREDSALGGCPTMVLRLMMQGNFRSLRSRGALAPRKGPLQP
jgi:hypothetical protein